MDPSPDRAGTAAAAVRTARPNKKNRKSSSIGLNPIYEASVDPADIVADIVAIPGFTGDSERTWTAANGVMWLRDLLPRDFPMARIFTWGYAGFSNSKSMESIQDLAKSLVHDLSRKRILSWTPEDRPIIFIVYDIGGLILKRALLYSQEMMSLRSPDQYAPVHSLTSGVIFIATPHQSVLKHQFASDLNEWSRFRGLLGRKRRLYGPGKSKELLKSENEEFVQLVSQRAFISIVSAYATLSTSLFGLYQSMIVPIKSAIIEGMESEPIALDANHMNAPKFTDNDDPNYVRISESLELIIRKQVSSSSLSKAKARPFLAISDGEVTSDVNVGPSRARNDNGNNLSGRSPDEVTFNDTYTSSQYYGDGIESSPPSYPSRREPQTIRRETRTINPEGMRTERNQATANCEKLMQGQRRHSVDGEIGKRIRTYSKSSRDPGQTLGTSSLNPNTSFASTSQPTISTEWPLSSNVSSPREVLEAISSLPLKVGQAASSTAAVLDPVWTKASIGAATATATATVAIAGVNANTNRKMASISKRSAAIADRAADANEQNALAALSAADTAARKLAFDVEESMKKKGEQGSNSNGTAVVDNISSAVPSKSVAPSKAVLPVAMPPTKPSSTQMQFEARISKRYEEIETQKQQEKQRKAKNIQGFKNLLKHPFKGSASAKEEDELSKRLRERRNNQGAIMHVDTETHTPKSKGKGKGKEIDTSSVLSGSSTSADLGDGDHEESRVICGQGPQSEPSASISNEGNGETNRNSTTKSVKDASPVSNLQTVPPKAGEQHLRRSESESSSYHSLNITGWEDIQLNTLSPPVHGMPASSPDLAGTENEILSKAATPEADLTLPVNEAATTPADKDPDSNIQPPNTPLNIPVSDVNVLEQKGAEVIAKDASSSVPSETEQEDPSSAPPKIT